jgi:hypothetical protein
MFVPVGLSGEQSDSNRAWGNTAAICSGLGWKPCSRRTGNGSAPRRTCDVVVVVPRRDRVDHRFARVHQCLVRGIDERSRTTRHDHGLQRVVEFELAPHELHDRASQFGHAVGRRIVRVAGVQCGLHALERRRHRELSRVEVPDGQVQHVAARRDDRAHFAGDAEHFGTDQALGESRQRGREDGGRGKPKFGRGAQGALHAKGGEHRFSARDPGILARGEGSRPGKSARSGSSSGRERVTGSHR